jgi:NitT/TauT family transport system substrate-binding protein
MRFSNEEGMMMSARRRICLAIAVLAGCLNSFPALAADTLKVRLDWTPWGNQAPMHFAAQKELFKKYGLDVTLDDGNGSVSTVQIVGNGEYDVGHASLAPMVIARSKGLPLKAFAGFVQRNDIGLLVPADSNIRSPADLKGKKIAFTAGSLEAPFIDRFLAVGKLTRNDVELLNVSAAAKAGTYVSGGADGAFSSVPFFLPVVSSKRPSTSLNFADYGLQFPSFGLFATEKTLQDKAAALRRFASVVSGCWAYILNNHVDEGVQAIIAARPQAKLDPDVLRKQIESIRAFSRTQATENQPFGVMAGSDWQTALQVLAEGGLLDQKVQSDEVFTNDLIDKNIVADIGNGKF